MGTCDSTILLFMELTELLSKWSCAMNSSRIFRKFGAGLRGDRITDGVSSTRLFIVRSSISISLDRLLFFSAGSAWSEIDQDPDACSLVIDNFYIYSLAQVLSLGYSNRAGGPPSGVILDNACSWMVRIGNVQIVDDVLIEVDMGVS